MTRKYVILFSLVLGLFMAANASAQYSRIKDILTTDHNLSSTGPGTIKAVSNTQVCYYCHVPHEMQSSGDPAVTTAPNDQPPLWNHYLSSKASYGVYSSPSFDAMGTDIHDLGGAVAGSATVSNLCLSCHDGTVGINTLYKGQHATGGNVSPSFYNASSVASGNNVPVYMPTDIQMGGADGLREEHPINFTYDATLAGKSVSLVVPITNAGGTGGTRLGLPTSSGKFLPLFSDGSGNPKMQCATCHDVHSNGAGRPFLRASTTASEICLACHGK